MGPANWFAFTPAIALNPVAVSSTSDQVAVIYPAQSGTNDVFAGHLNITRSASTGNITSSWFNHQAAYRVTPGANSNSMVIAASSDGGWVALAGSDGTTGGNLNLASIAPTVALPATNPVYAVTTFQLTSVADSSDFDHPAISEYFDDSGTNRHGVAFVALKSGSNRNIYVSKIASNPSTKNEAGYFDSSSYYDNTAGNDIAAEIQSVPILAASTGNSLNMVKISYASDGAGHFYVGWRNQSTAKVEIVRVEAKPTGIPVVDRMESTHLIDKMSPLSSTSRGQAGYAIAAGVSSSGTPIVGAVFVQDNNGTNNKCRFLAFRYRSSSTSMELFKTSSVGLDVSTVSPCRFPQLFFNRTSGKFIAVYVHDDATSASDRHDTIVSEFKFDDGADPEDWGSLDGALSPATPGKTVMTSRSALPCQLTAGYSDTNKKLVTASLEGDCAGGSTNLTFDIYKVYGK
jgi:hypothetical protein